MAILIVGVTIAIWCFGIWLDERKPTQIDSKKF